MAKCKYELNIDNSVFRFDSEKELNNFVLANKIKGKNALKLSLDLSVKQSGVINAIEELSNNSKYNEPGIFKSEEFLAFKHDVGKGEVYLTPYFDLNKYITNKVAEEKLSVEDSKIREEELKREIEESDLSSISGQWHKVIKIAVENRDKGFTEQISKLEPSIKDFIESIETYNKIKYTDEEMELIINNIYHQVDSLLKFNVIQEANFTNLKVANETGKVKDSIDIISVSSDGVPHIIDIALSRKPYREWDSAKLGLSAYKLGIQKQLLESVCPTKNSSLYVIPFYLPETNGILDLFNFSITSPITRSNEAWLKPEGQITQQLSILIPGKFTDFHVDGSEADENNKQLLNAILGTSYVISSKRQIESKENEIKKIIKYKEEHNADEYVLYDLLVGKPIKIKNKEDIEKVVDDYIQRYNNSKNSEVYRLRNTLKNAIANEEKSIDFGKDSSSAILNSNFEKYLNGDWEIIENSVFLNQDLIVFRNNHYKTIEVVSITTNSFNSVYNFGLGKTLIGKFKTDVEASKDNNILPSTTVNVEVLKALVVLNNAPELFEGYTLGNIKVINYKDGDASETDLDTLIYNFKKVFKLANSKGELNSIDNFSNNIIKQQNKAEYYYQEILLKLSASKYSALRDKAKGSRLDVIEDKIKWFYQIQKLLVEKESKLQEDPGKVLDYGNENTMAYLRALVDEAITYYSGIRFSMDYAQPTIGLTWGDAGHLPITILSGNSKEYNSKGQKIVGLLGGSLFATSGLEPSRDISKIMDYVSMGHSKRRELYAPIANQTTTWTNEYYKECGRSGLEQTLIGNADQYHIVFMKKNDKGEIHDSFSTKNPYDLKENLKDHERKYLKKILWELYKDKQPLPEVHQKLTVEEAEKLPEFEEYRNHPQYLLLPLKKKTDSTKWKSLTTNDLRKAIGKRFEDIKDILDDRNLTDIHRQEFKKKEQMAFEMTNEFQISDETRTKLIHEYRPDYFEINLDTILLEHRYAAITKNVMDHVLQTVNAFATTLKVHAYKSGNIEEAEESFKNLFKQIRIAVYGANIIDPGMQDVIGGIKHLQKMASIMFITLRPLLTMKELIAGAFKNYSFAYTQVWGDQSFKLEHMNKAYEKVLFNGKQIGVEFGINQNFNLLYGIANMDVNSVVKKSKVDRKGALKFFSEHLYWLNNAGDYINRLTVFMAMAIKDGSYDAHYIDSNGVFKYDPSKDARFKVYFEKRQNYGFKSAPGDSEYNNQRSLYLSMLDDFNAENVKLGIKKIDEVKDLIPRAYTDKQRQSIKVFADTAYGFYDSEVKSLITNTAIGSIFGQFLTFLPAKIKFYFGKEQMSKYGDFRQKTGIDENGDEQLLWYKDTFDDDGNYLGKEETFENTGTKAQGFITDPWEGVLYSLGLTIRDILKGKYNETPIQRKRRAMIALNDLFMAMIVNSIIFALLQDFEENEETSDAIKLTGKAFYKASSEFNPFVLFTSVRWEPAFIGFAGNMLDIFTGMFDGNTNTEKMIRKTFKATELLPEQEE